MHRISAYWSQGCTTVLTYLDFTLRIAARKSTGEDAVDEDEEDEGEPPPPFLTTCTTRCGRRWWVCCARKRLTVGQECRTLADSSALPLVAGSHNLIKQNVL